MSKEIFDWKGNEVKEGMTIYFVATKRQGLSASRFGLLIPQENGKSEIVNEPEAEWRKRRDEDIWELGSEYEVAKRTDGGFNVIKGTDGFTFVSPIEWSISPQSVIAIKGISDTKD